MKKVTAVCNLVFLRCIIRKIFSFAGFFRKVLICLFFVFLSGLSAQDYLDLSLSPERRAADLLRQMTLDEKIGQMTQAERSSVAPGDLIIWKLGSVLSGGGSRPQPDTLDSWKKMYKDYQDAALATRLKIPMIYGIDAVHGHNNVYGAVIFPHNIGLGAARDPELMERIGRVTAYEVQSTGLDWTFSPCLAVARDERWGRTYESFGEDPELPVLLGGPYIRGLQSSGISACAKHFVGDGGATWGTGDANYAIDRGITQADEADLRRLHLAGYLPAIEQNVDTIMVSYSSWHRKKMHEHKYLIIDVLKKELGFQGFVVSDWDAIDEIHPSYDVAVERSVNAGIDMFMVPRKWRDFITTLKNLVQQQKVSLERIDDAVLRILTVKFGSGLFDDPYRSNDGSLFGSEEHRAVAREAVRKSLVLLQNAQSILPLKRDQKILVAGSGAHDLGKQCGGWTISWQGESGPVTQGTTIMEGMVQTAGRTGGVVYSLNAGGVQDFDVALVVTAENPYAEGRGDDSVLEFPRQDIRLIKKIRKSGIPVVVVILSGRPLILPPGHEDWEALVAAWLPGTEGKGVAQVLFGDYPFQGKLPCSWPRTQESLPVNAGDQNYDPLFHYAFGLSYTNGNTQ